MFGSHRFMLCFFCLSAVISVSLAIEESSDIEEDVISIANQTQKVIRVHPQDLPPKKDNTGSQMNSAFFQIQTLRPPTGSASASGSGPVSVSGQRQYVDSKQMRKRRPRPAKLMSGKGNGNVAASETQAAEAAKLGR
ncbi:uncharacterized protein LOC119550079 isoform X2 [Drosophila subpulchrella]|uniref:uncharacterized protein LOC119550079 isoform X2 n=1 Tax=Drosophila subpulchrella TaxID=1486046 RepID=UPI0018A1605D|nr:uncharacterized protein LOC119550079 isoform X2 [Drosophila subpulchrella]